LEEWDEGVEKKKVQERNSTSYKTKETKIGVGYSFGKGGDREVVRRGGGLKCSGVWQPLRTQKKEKKFEAKKTGPSKKEKRKSKETQNFLKKVGFLPLTPSGWGGSVWGGNR